MADAVKTTRADEVRQERRKKRGATVHTGIKLSVDESKLDRSTFQYRYVNDKGGRVQQLAAVDWDPAPEGAKEDASGTITATHAGVEEGKPFNAVLMRKRKDWFETDQKEKQRPLDEMDEAIRRGNVNHKANELHGPGVYTPGGVNIIERA